MDGALRVRGRVPAAVSPEPSLEHDPEHGQCYSFSDRVSAVAQCLSPLGNSELAFHCRGLGLLQALWPSLTVIPQAFTGLPRHKDGL